jgi:4-hydroxy-3-methylbut-2-enyl diphosphate reductase IspH
MVAAPCTRMAITCPLVKEGQNSLEKAKDAEKILILTKNTPHLA